MSIIQEALKKAQDYIGESRNRPPPASLEKEKDKISAPLTLEASAERRDEAEKKSAAFPNIYLLLILLVTLGFVLKGFLPETKSMAKPAAKKSAGREDASSHQQITYKPLKAEEGTGAKTPEPVINTQIGYVAKPRYPDLVLNGIMYLTERPQAIINDLVVEEGDTVSGAKVVSIRRNTVLLNYNDTEISLTLKK